MPRQPRSAEPRGSHTFFGPISSDRLSPFSVPDPLSLATITATTALIATGTLNVTGVTTIGTLTAGAIAATTVAATTSMTAANIFALGSSADLGQSGAKFDVLFLNTGNITTLNTTTGNITTTNTTTGNITTVNSTTINTTNLNVDHIDDDGNGTVTFKATINFVDGTKNIGTASIKVATLYVDDIGATGDRSDNVWATDAGITTLVSTTVTATTINPGTLDMGQGVLKGIRVITSNPTVASMAIGELILGDTGGGANTGRIFIKVNATEVYSFVSDAIIT